MSYRLAAATLFVFIVAVFVPGEGVARTFPDYLIMRDGVITPVEVVRLGNDGVTCATDAEGVTREIVVPLADVYMIHTSTRGNTYVTAEGQRITGENRKVDKEASLIYLIAGKEIPAYNVAVDTEGVSYTDKPRKGTAQRMALADVFMVLYADGVSDVFHDLTIKPVEPEPVVEVAPAEPEPVAPEPVEITHTVVRGETLGAIASKYAVTVNDIKRWNKLSSKSRSTTRLKAGLKLKIFVLPVTD